MKLQISVASNTHYWLQNTKLLPPNDINVLANTVGSPWIRRLHVYRHIRRINSGFALQSEQAASQINN